MNNEQIYIDSDVYVCMYLGTCTYMYAYALKQMITSLLASLTQDWDIMNQVLM